PYPLLAPAIGESNEGIVAGSEAIWLDGARLKRGADADYVIDYGASTVTFTIHRPITAQSRIAVDFEAASSRYRRSLYAASTQGNVPGRGGWYANYVSEGDDPSNPIGAERARRLGRLDPSERRALCRSGARILRMGRVGRRESALGLPRRLARNIRRRVRERGRGRGGLLGHDIGRGRALLSLPRREPGLLCAGPRARGAQLPPSRRRRRIGAPLRRA